MAQWKCSPIGWPVILVHSHTGEVKDRQKLWNWHFIPTNHKGKKRMVLLIGHPGEPPFWQHWFASPLCCMHGSSSLAFPWSPLLSPTNCISYQIPKRLSGSVGPNYPPALELPYIPSDGYPIWLFPLQTAHCSHQKVWVWCKGQNQYVGSIAFYPFLSSSIISPQLFCSITHRLIPISSFTGVETPSPLIHNCFLNYSTAAFCPSLSNSSPTSSLWVDLHENSPVGEIQFGIKVSLSRHFA